MNDYELEQQIADVLKKARHDSGKSQEYISEKLGVSRKAVENWENGTSCPNVKMMIKWFHILGLDIVRYMNPIIHPAAEFSSGTDANQKREAVISITRSMSEEEVTNLYHLMAGDYPGSSISVMELAMAYLQLSLQSRICIAENIILAYEMSEASGTLHKIDGMEPNTRLIHIAIRKAMEAIKNGEDHYSSILEV